jgi:hypothetical protein
MEHLFSPCTRLFDIFENHNAFAEADDRDRFFENVAHLTEFFETGKELNLDVSTEELLSAETAFTYADLYAIIENGRTVAWLTPHAAVVRADDEGSYGWELINESFCFCFNVDGKVISAFARSREDLLEICNVLLRLLAAGVAHSVILSTIVPHDRTLINLRVWNISWNSAKV